MQEQNYEKHVKLVPPFHFVVLPLLLLCTIGAVINLFHSLGDHSRLYNASLILVLSVAVSLLSFFARVFPLQAQDRAIRAEENLRHFVLTGKLLDKRLTVKQIVGLRFAPDSEFAALAERAANESLSQRDIKRAIKNWKADYERL